MYRDRDFDLERDLPWNEAALTQDLELDVLFDAMAQGDPFLFRVAKTAVLTAVENDLDTIRYRQDILQDCLNHPSVIRDLYSIAAETIEGHPMAMQMRFLQTLVEVGAENNSTVVFPVPLDLLAALLPGTPAADGKPSGDDADSSPAESSGRR